MRRLALGVLLFAGCKAIPLSGDPTTPSDALQVSPPALFQVDWWRPLVKSELLEWQPRETARPAVDPDTERIIVATRDGVIRCLEPDGGTVVWEVRTPGKFFSGATIVGGIAYVPGGDVLYALRALTGEKLWEYRANEELVTTPVIVEGKALVSSQGETIAAVDIKTGRYIWQYRRDAPPGFTIRGAAQPTVVDGLVYTGFADGSLVALGLDDGVVRWERQLSLGGAATQFNDVDTGPVVDENGHVYAASFRDGVYALDAKTGDILWASARPGITSLLLRGDVLFASGDGSLSAVETKQGRALWTLDLSDRTPKGKGNNAGRAPVFARGYIIVPTSTALAFVDPATGRVRTAWNPGRGVSATPFKSTSVRHGPRLYVLSNLGTVFALRLSGG